MATPDRRMVSRPQRPGKGPKESGACLSPLDNLECKETQELVPVELAMLSKAQEFFQTCDTEGKGFIARRDMQVRGQPTWNAKWHGSLHLGLGPAPLGEVKVPSTLPWKEMSASTLLGARSPRFIPFLAFACRQTHRLFPLSDSVTVRFGKW